MTTKKNNGRNNDKENGSEKKGVGKVQEKKVVYINLSKTFKKLTMNVTFKGHANFCANVTLPMM